MKILCTPGISAPVKCTFKFNRSWLEISVLTHRDKPLFTPPTNDFTLCSVSREARSVVHFHPRCLIAVGLRLSLYFADNPSSRLAEVNIVFVAIHRLPPRHFHPLSTGSHSICLVKWDRKKVKLVRMGFEEWIQFNSNKLAQLPWLSLSSYHVKNIFKSASWFLNFISKRLQSTYYWHLSFKSLYWNDPDDGLSESCKWNLVRDVYVHSTRHKIVHPELHCWSQIERIVFAFVYVSIHPLYLYRFSRNLQTVLKQQSAFDDISTRETTYRSSNLEIRCFNLACDDAYWKCNERNVLY